MSISVLIADDEPHARRYLFDLLTNISNIHIIGQCRNGREALALIKSSNPDLVLLDIQMPGIDGIQVAKQLKTSNALVIFTTAYDAYAIKAFEVEALNYLLKPFSASRFYEVFEQAKKMIQLQRHQQLQGKLGQLYEEFQEPKRAISPELIIKEKGLIKKIQTKDILLLEAQSIYVKIYLSKRTYLYRAPLHQLEEELSADFLRIHRSYIINTRMIKHYKYLNNNTFSFMMLNEMEIISSRSYKTSIQQKFS